MNNYSVLILTKSLRHCVSDLTPMAHFQHSLSGLKLSTSLQLWGTGPWSGSRKNANTHHTVVRGDKGAMQADSWVWDGWMLMLMLSPPDCRWVWDGWMLMLTLRPPDCRWDGWMLTLNPPDCRWDGWMLMLSPPDSIWVWEMRWLDANANAEQMALEWIWFWSGVDLEPNQGQNCPLAALWAAENH